MIKYVTEDTNLAYIMPWIFLAMVIFMRVTNSKTLYKGINMSKDEFWHLLESSFNLQEFMSNLSHVLAFTYLFACGFDSTDIRTTIHLGAFTILLVWLKVTFTIGKNPQFGIYITIVSYVGWEVFKLILLYLTTLWGKSSLLDTSYVCTNV